MSLLIKALESAEKGKQAERQRGKAKASSSVDLLLEPLPTAREAVQKDEPASNAVAKEPYINADSFDTTEVASAASVKQQFESKKDNDRQIAANVFVANQAAKTPASASALLMLGIAGALTIWLGLQGYQYLSKPNAHDAVIVEPVSRITTLSAEITPSVESSVQVAGLQTGEATQTQITDTASSSTPEVNTLASASETAAFITNDTVGSKPTVSKKPEARNLVGSSATEYDAMTDEGVSETNKRPPLKLVSRIPAAGVDPTLLAAYQAYSRGDDAVAQKQYRQVLQADVRNVDALLGMAAIALRQSRYMDANGWYQKVLEIEPRNTIALSAMANSQIRTESAGPGVVDFVDTESRIKSMLAQQPEAANLHATLGNLYAAQNQWSLAQAAYFNACRYAPNSADYAFNLAVSLDQLGKSRLALVQYQRALDLLNSTGSGNFDRAQLEARIQVLQ